MLDDYFRWDERPLIIPHDDLQIIWGEGEIRYGRAGKGGKEERGREIFIRETQGHRLRRLRALNESGGAPCRETRAEGISSEAVQVKPH